jgi:hypothetical protein
MRRVGILLLAIGLAGFLLATTQRARYDTVEGGFKAAFSSNERAKREGWETARWMLLGVAVVGVVFTVLPGKKS